MHQHFIRGQRHITKPRSEEDKRRKDRHQQGRADQDVGVDQRHADQHHAVEHTRPVTPVGSRKSSAAQVETKARPQCLGNHGGKGHAAHAPAQPQHEPQIQQHVGPVHDELYPEYPRRALHRHQPAGQRKDRDGAGCRPDANGHVGPRQPFDLVRRRSQREGCPEQQRLQNDQPQPAARCDQQCTGQQRRNLGAVARTFGLSDHADRAHAQEPEHPVERADDNRAQRHGPDGSRLAQLPHYADIHRAKDRHGGIAEYDGKRDRQHTAMGDRGSGYVRNSSRGR